MPVHCSIKINKLFNELIFKTKVINSKRQFLNLKKVILMSAQVIFKLMKITLVKKIIKISFLKICICIAYLMKLVIDRL